MIKAIHNRLSDHIHVPNSLDKLLLFIPYVLVWIFTLPFIGLIIVAALGIYCAVQFQMDTTNIAVCVVCGLMTILHIIDIIGRVKGDSDGSDISNDDSNPLQ
ncbi:MAG: hypothetical protein II850_07245 [Fibrobacter sp.]|nr:hypothetical protein [Fibrobacter sp.]